MDFAQATMSGRP